MDRDDKEYIDSVMDVAGQDIRHYFDLTDEETIKLMRDSLDRLDTDGYIEMLTAVSQAIHKERKAAMLRQHAYDQRKLSQELTKTRLNECETLKAATEYRENGQNKVINSRIKALNTKLKEES